MTKVYIKFGEPLPDEDHIYVYEGTLEDNYVRIILPTVLYSSCVNAAKDIELPAYIVEGNLVGKDNNGQPILMNYKVVANLIFDKDKECYKVKTIHDLYKGKINSINDDKPKFENLEVKTRETRDDTLTALVGFGIGRVLRVFNRSKKQKSINLSKFTPHES